MQNYSTLNFYGLKDNTEFVKGIQHSVNQIDTQVGIFTGDNLFTYNRNLSFLSDEKFMQAFNKNALDSTEKSIIWRNYVVCWAALNAMKLEGDLVEAACYKGTTARIIWDYINAFGPVEKNYYLYDLFDHDQTMPHHSLPAHSAKLYEEVKQKFSDSPNVHVIQGKVPDSFSIAAPEKVAFLHLDMNHAVAEIAALEVLFDRMVPGAVMILDDYGWAYYRAQKEAEDPWLAKRGYHVLELPTGQGMVIKQ